MKISDTVIESIKNKSWVKAKLMLAFNKDSRTIEIWFKKNSMALTTPLAMRIIKEETGLTEEEILVDEPVKA